MPSPGLTQTSPAPPGRQGLPTGLRRNNFRCLASQGFGDTRNSYAHAMNWFRGRLYVGTTRNIFQLVKIAPDPSTDTFHLWPVYVPPGLDARTLEQQCQIWRCDPETGRSHKVFESPRVDSHDGARKVWRDFGYRNMVVHQTGSDTDPTLYVSTMSSSQAPGALILRSVDGEEFHPVTDPGLGDTRVSSFRGLVGFDGRLFAAPAGSGRLWAYSDETVVLESRDPLSRKWVRVCEPGFGDPTNAAIFDMAVFDGHLYAGVSNPHTGIQVYKTEARGNPPYRWKKVLGDGAGRGKLNQAVMSMGAFKDHIYVGTGIRRGGYDREFKTGPAAGELIRIDREDRWDLVVGEARRTPEREIQPLSGLGPGFDNPFNGYIWCMAEYDGCLYVGTYDSSIFLWWVDPNRVPNGSHSRLRLIGVQPIVDREAGFDLWRSPDGVHWYEVTRDGFGNPYNYGVRTLLGNDRGLFVGTANPFGPEVAVKTPAGWIYTPNPKGGLEIWLGRQDFDAAVDGSPIGNGPVRAGSDLLAGAAGEMRAGALGNGPVAAGGIGHAAAGGSDRPGEARGGPGGVVRQHYDRAMYTNPLLRSGEYFSNSRFSNYGYWEDGTPNQKEACENLMERLLDYLPERRGRILDVACGLGATSRHLGLSFGPENVTGINISDKQIETCRETAPGSSFLMMDATQLEFEDESFDHVICVEAAFHFRTRSRFLREAYRILRPGGCLVLSDMLFTEAAEKKSLVLHEANHVSGPGAYRRVLEGAGFEAVRVIDATYESFLRCNEHFLGYLTAKYQSDEVEPRFYIGALANRLALLLSLRYYTLAGGRKPGGPGIAGPHDHPASPFWENSMPSDPKIQTARKRRAQRLIQAHSVLSTVARSQGRLHRELALLLEKEAEALGILDRFEQDEDAPPAAGGATEPAPGGVNLHQIEAAKQEALAHKDLALRSDARALRHRTLATLQMRTDEASRIVRAVPRPRRTR